MAVGNVEFLSDHPTAMRWGDTCKLESCGRIESCRNIKHATMNGSTSFERAVMDELAGMRSDMQALTQGLMLQIEVQEAHGEMLQRILEAAAQEGPQDDTMEQLIGNLAQSLDRLTVSVLRLDRGQTRLTSRLASAIVRGAGPDQPDADASKPE